MNNQNNSPRHVAIIMDGNGRWARQRALPRIAGHREGAKAAREAIKAAGELGINVLTLYTFSTENWKRPAREVSALFGLLKDYLNKEETSLIKNNIRLSVIGKISGLPQPLRERLERTIETTAKNDGLILNLALNYGSRTEIVDACRAIARDVKEGKLAPEELDEVKFSGYLYTNGLPDPDLLIRTSGESRVSNFLLWQISYSEIYISKKLWPDFKKADLKKAVNEYSRRERRFGG